MSLKWNYILFHGEVGKVEEQKREWGVKRGRTRDLIKVVGMNESCDGNRELSLASVAYRVVYSSLEFAIWRSCWTGSQLHYYLGSGKRQGVQDEEWFIFWTGPPWKTSMIHAAQGHTGSCGPRIIGCVETIGSRGYACFSSSWESCWCLWPNLPPKTILEFILLKRSISRSILLLQPESVLMSVVHVTY